MVLLVADHDGAPFDGRLEGAFEAEEQPDGVADACIAKEGPGRFRAVLPPGAWRIRLSRPGDAQVCVPVEVPASGVVTVEAPRLPRQRP